MNRQALLISNSQYQDPKLRTLQTPAADVQALHAVLADPRIGNFDVEALVDQNMDQTRRQIARFFDKRKPDDMLLLYFTGHGVLNDDSRLHLATVDTEHDIPEASAVEASFVAARMKRCRAKSQILILDCCHSGAFAKESTKGKNVGDSVGTQAAFDGIGTGHVILTASDMLQYAYEGDEVAGEASLSVFTHFLVAGLQSGDADLNSDGQITADELYDYVYQRMQAEVSDELHQTPLLIVPGQQGEIVVARNPFVQQALPPGIQEALDNPLLDVRLVAVQRLAELLGNARYAAIAQVTLKKLTKDDCRTVSNAAQSNFPQQKPQQNKPVAKRQMPRQANWRRWYTGSATGVAAAAIFLLFLLAYYGSIPFNLFDFGMEASITDRLPESSSGSLAVTSPGQINPPDTFEAALALARQKYIAQDMVEAQKIIASARSSNLASNDDERAELEQLFNATENYLNAKDQTAQVVAMNNILQTYIDRSDALYAAQDYCGASAEIESTLALVPPSDIYLYQGRLSDYGSRCQGIEQESPLIVDNDEPSGF